MKTLRLFGVLPLMCALPVIPGAHAQTSDDGMSSISAPGSAGDMTGMGAGTDSAAAARGALDVRIGQLETELRAITGKMEVMQHELQLLQDQKADSTGKDDLAGLEARVAALEQKPAASPADPAASGAMPPQPEAESAGSLTQPDKIQPDKASADSGAHFTGGTAKPSGTVAASGPVAASLGVLSESPGGSATKPVANSPDQAYEQAFAQFKAGKYDDSARSFQAFLVKYPKHPLAGNAQYWIGETLYARSQFDKAAKAFALDYQTYPQSPKAPEALLKLGMSLNGLGKSAEACLTYAQLKKQFPSAAPTLARAVEEGKKAKCK